MSLDGEQRYQSIFHEVPIALLEQDWSDVRAALKTLGATGVTDFARYFAEHPHAAGELAAKIGILDANRYFLDFVGAATLDDLHAILPRMFDEDSWPVFVRELVAFAHDEVHFEDEVVIRSLAGRRRHILISVTKLAGPGADRVRALVSFIDISQRKQMEETLRTLNAELARANAELQRANAELERANGELQRSNAELERFAYMASHDLQEPLRSVEGYTTLLRRYYQGKLDERADKYIGFAMDGARRMRKLVDGLLALARVGVQGKPLVPTDCNQVLADLLTSLAPVIQDTGAIITYDHLPTVDADASQLTQLLQNLLANAIKFRGDAPPRVHISAARDGNAWTFSVADNGIGIESHLREQIFDVFRRLHTRQEYPGTGIGLALAKSIVERHNGRIWVESTPGRGSTFRFSIPARAPIGLNP